MFEWGDNIPLLEHTVRWLYEKGYRKAALNKLCPYSEHNPWSRLGINKYPRGYLRRLKFL